MFTRLNLVWIVASRELRDQFRDWRVLMPMLILVLCFPFLMNEFAKQTVDFLNQYNANLILDRLVPFSIMIIGFFPITVSLVVALEAFVGEKERGTIEPLLSSPMENWQLYFGKLLVGVITPLIASYLSIGLYMWLILTKQELTIPPFMVMLQLLLLTGAHAFLMVSAAIVISVQSTSVKAANLLASFIVIPVAILMQGEAVMLFWGNEQVLWLAILGVMIIALLLIRVGIAHFHREYLLGREIDVINMAWIWRTLRSNFLGDAHSIPSWYSSVFWPAFRRVLPAALVLLAVAAASIWMGYNWSLGNVPRLMESAEKDEVEKISRQLSEFPDLRTFNDHFSAPFLFINNTRATFIVFLAGLASFSVLGVLIYIVNISLIGGLFGLYQVFGLQPWPIFLAGVLPHGILELPAFLIGSAAMLYFGASIVTPQVGKSMGEVILELLADWAKIFIGLVVPLMAMAALIEAYITPMILEWCGRLNYCGSLLG
jgi:uncharacterized membrane protein SpoIIM required for sporulation